MRQFLLLFFCVIVAGSLWQAFTHDAPAFAGISDQAAVPANIKPIELAEIKRIIAQEPYHVIFLYASWCPYCHKQLEGFRLYAQQKKLPPITAISIDQQPKQFSAFIAKQRDLPFEPRIYRGGSELKDYLASMGGNFNGAIPYFVAFTDGKISAEFIGLTHPDKLQR